MAGSTEDNTATDGPRANSGPLSVIFPGSDPVIREARKIVGDNEKRMDAAAEIVEKDPVAVIEFLKTANALAYTEGKPPVTTTRGAIVRLGATSSIEVLDRVKEFPKLENEDIAKLFEEARKRCQMVAETAKLIAGLKAQNLADDCYTAGLLKNIGELVAILHLGEVYLQIVTTNKSRAQVLYRLEKDHSFDIEKSTVAYLRRAGITDNLLFAVDPEAQTKTPNRAVMKPVVSAAMEMVIAFDSNRWDKIAPDKNLPPKSTIRMLNLSDSQYESLYDKVGEILFQIDPEKREQTK
ncbi:MAG: HDOD domain-containing protein [Bdellovibrionota bacterium]